MLIPSVKTQKGKVESSLSRRVNANSQRYADEDIARIKLIKKGEC